MKGAPSKNHDPNVLKAARISRGKVSSKLKRTPVARDEKKRLKSIQEAQNRKSRIDDLIAKGATDSRKARICKLCQKRCVRDEDYIFQQPGFDETRTRSQYDRRRNTFHWQQDCVLCKLANRRKNYRKGGVEFLSNIAKSTLFHVGGTMEQARKLVSDMIKESGGLCKSCGVEVLSRGSSGWQQLSITDMFPDRRTVEKRCGKEDLAIVCLACQKFQNDLSWDVFLSALRDIAKGPDDKSKPTRPWPLKTDHTRGGDGCPIHIQQQIILRDGLFCAYTGLEAYFEKYHWRTASWDRYDSSLPYTLENTHLVCKNINYVKSRAVTEAHLLEWISHIRLSVDNQKLDINAGVPMHRLRCDKIEDIMSKYKKSNTIQWKSEFVICYRSMTKAMARRKRSIAKLK